MRGLRPIRPWLAGLIALLAVLAPTYGFAQTAPMPSGAHAQTSSEAATPAEALKAIAASIDQAISAAEAGDTRSARAHFSAFDTGWDELEDRIRPIARDSYRAIETAMSAVSRALPNDQAPAAPGVAPLRQLKAVIAQQLPAITAGQSVRTRVYYVAAEETDWDYAPTGQNAITGEAFDETANTFVQPGPDRIGRVYRKSVYRAYTDATFTVRAPVETAWRHLGLLGPVIRAEVGDVIQVHFKNNTHFPASIHAHGVRYGKEAEGAPYADGTSEEDKEDDAIDPGESIVYTWEVPERAGPGPMDPSSIVWMYHSHVDEVADTNAGLVGPLIVTRKGSARADGSPVDVDREFVTLFTVTDENASPHLDDNIRRFARESSTVVKDDADFRESNHMHGINGFVYGNLPGLTMRQNERVRWYLLDVGSELDLHTPHWHGQAGLMGGMRTDMAELLPGSMKTFDMVPDVAGTWLFHCHVNDHILAGMQALFTVQPPQQ